MLATDTVALEAGLREATYWKSWFEAVERIPGNPFGIDIRTIGTVTAIRCEEIPVSDYNRVLRLSDNDADRVGELVRFYSERLTPFRIDLIPDWASSEVLGELDKAGFRPADFQTVLAGEPRSRFRKYPRGVVVEEASQDDIGRFCDLFEEAYYGAGQPRRLKIFRETSIRCRMDDPRWRFYLATVDGLDAGGGTLFVDGDAATLAGGATLPAMRGRGCQSALLQRRVEDAGALGCEVVFGRCRSGSVSQHNMQKAGLTSLYTKTIWQHRWAHESVRKRSPREAVGSSTAGVLSPAVGSSTAGVLSPGV